MAKTDFKTVDEYIQTFPEEVRQVLEKVRQAVHKAAPEAGEVISYQMPTFRQNGILVHFAAFKDHIGFYPTPSGIRAFEKELSKYEGGKGSVKFPLDEPMPLDLITEIVKFRVQENLNNQ